FMAEALDIGEKEVEHPEDSPEEKKRKLKVNMAIDKKIRFKANNQKLLDSIMQVVDQRRIESGGTNG
ncbi:MAG: hypothetical protein ACPGYT_11925, partial [Nitrospirales bacterium]